MFIGLVIVIAVFTTCMMLRSRPQAVAIATITPRVWCSSPPRRRRQQ
jgi:hypothetical protein